MLSRSEFMSQVQTDNSRPLNRRTTSIAKKINRSYWFDSLLRMIFLDIIAIAAIVACYFYTWETKLSGTIVDRHFENGYETAEYVVTMEGGFRVDGTRFAGDYCS